MVQAAVVSQIQVTVTCSYFPDSQDSLQKTAQLSVKWSFQLPVSAHLSVITKSNFVQQQQKHSQLLVNLWVISFVLLSSLPSCAVFAECWQSARLQSA